MTTKYSWIVGIFFLTLSSPSLSYNLEERLPLFKFGPENSKFGFSLAMHRTTTDDTVGSAGTLLLAGGPTAKSVRSPERDAPKNPGGVFYCPVSTDPNDCLQVELDEGIDVTTTTDTRTAVSFSSRQWIGASLKSLGPGKNLVTCGHRHTLQNQTTELSKDEWDRVCGRCFLLKGTPDQQIEEVRRGSSDFPPGFVSDFCDKFSVDVPGRHDRYLIAYGYNQAGLSMAALDEEFVVGAPGTWTFHGALFDFDLFGAGKANTGLTQSPTCFYKERGRDSNGDLFCFRLPVGPDTPHIGFSVAMSRAVNGTSGKLYFATGAPTANETGVVLIFTKGTYRGKPELVPDLSNTVGGEKVASSFGFSVAFSDVNGDKLDDLIVGAPQYFDYKRKSKVGGAVYVYLKNPSIGFSDVTPKILLGPKASHFGHSVTALGDLDQDGYEDFAVGAPYAETNGAVYIFRGGPEGPKESQVIQGSLYNDIGHDIVGFGASLSGSFDADGNRYPDLLIGTRSDSMALLRSRPIISVHSSLRDIPEELDLEEKRCGSGGGNYSCFHLTYCLRYETRLENYPDGVSIWTQLTLDTFRKDKKLASRIRFDSPKGRDKKIKKKLLLRSEGKEKCFDHEVYFLHGVEDKLTDIKVDFEFDLNLPEIERETVGSPIFNMSDDPILDRDLKKYRSKVMKIKNGCGEDGCQSNLKISAVITKEVVIGKDDSMFVNVTTSNDGEEAHQATVFVNIPNDLDFVDYKVVSGSAKGIACSNIHRGGYTDIACILGNPYKSGMKNTISIELLTRRLEPGTRQLNVTVEGSTTSFNPVIQAVPLKSSVVEELFLSLSWASQPDLVTYTQKEILGESGMKNTDDIGPSITYRFMIENTAPFPARGAMLKVDMPTESENGKWLLYLVDADVVYDDSQSVGNCNSTYVNTLQIEPSITASASVSSRSKRSLEDTSEEEPRAEAVSGGSYANRLPFSCQDGKARCKTIQCSIDEIPQQSTIAVIMAIRLWEATFIEEYSSIDLISLRTDVSVATVRKNVRIRGKTSGTVETVVDRELNETDVYAEFPWWYILIAAVVLSLFYIIGIVVLFKCGFFKRRRFHRANKDNQYQVMEQTESKM